MHGAWIKIPIVVFTGMAVATSIYSYRLLEQVKHDTATLDQFDAGLASAATALDYSEPEFQSGPLAEPDAPLARLGVHAHNTLEQIADLHGYIAEIQGERAELEARIAATQEEWELARRGLAGLEEQVDAVRVLITVKQREGEGLEARIAAEDQAIEASEQQIAAQLEHQAENEDEITRWKRIIARHTGDKEIDPYAQALDGRVISVNPDWNFVVIDLGTEQGLRLEAEGVVHHESTLRGKIRISRLENRLAIANIKKGWNPGDFSVGDRVFFERGML